jgi:hypothetical protein
MKASSLLFLFAGALLLTACESTVVERRPVVVQRRYVAYSDRDPYYRVYYRENDGRTYYRRHYYDDDPVYRGRVDTRRYYYTGRPGPVDRSYGF